MAKLILALLVLSALAPLSVSAHGHVVYPHVHPHAPIPLAADAGFTLLYLGLLGGFVLGGAVVFGVLRSRKQQ